ncbi:DNA ligase [Streptomyces badius]
MRTEAEDRPVMASADPLPSGMRYGPARVRVGGVEFPIRPALARAVTTLPTGPTWHFEIKLDGHRMILRRTGGGVVCCSRTGRTVTSHWMDLAVPAMEELLPGTTLGGEAVIWHDGRMDFGAVQARAASTLERARALAARLPATYAAFDVLAHPDHGGDAVAARPYTERRTVRRRKGRGWQR